MKVLDPKDTSRARAFELWMNAPMPMVTLTVTLDVTNLRNLSKRKGVKFNMLICWCIGKAAAQVPEFFVLPVDGKLIEYEKLAVNTIVANFKGGINSCDIPFSEDIHTFGSDYYKLTRQVAHTCEDHDISERMVIGTSALTDCEIDSVSGMYSRIYCNPFLTWGRFRKGLFKTTLPVSFQFHHTQMDGAHAARFLALLQEEIKQLSF